jgi:hypothetical protein
VLASEPLGLPCDELALRVRRHRASVIGELQSDPRFERHGRTRGTRWRLAAGPWVGMGRNLRVTPGSSSDPWVVQNGSGPCDRQER